MPKPEHADSLYICPWSLRDPLCQSQTLAYLHGLTAFGYKFALITFENPVHALAAELETQKSELAALGIYWYPIEYHAGLSIKAKALDNLKGVLTGIKIWRRHNPRVVHSRSSLAAAMAVAVAKLLRLRFLYDADSMLSEEYADVGHWSRQSAGFRIMSQTENLARRAAAEIVVLSETLKQDLIDKYGVKTRITVIPCCVDLEKYAFNPKARAKRRGELNLTNEKLLIYVGKIGGRYLVENAFEFFKIASRTIENLKLLIVSGEGASRFDEIAQRTNVAREQYFVKSAESAEVAEWLSAADGGLAVIKGAPSERGASPIKIAEYLAAGLPVVITEGVGDCSQLIREKNVGAILNSLDSNGYAETADALRDLFDETANDVSTRARQTAEDQFSLEKIGVAHYRQIYQRLLP